MSILSRLARALGWNPVGINVNLKIDESAFSSNIGKELTANIASVQNDGSFVLKLDDPLMQEAQKVQEVIAYPRHSGYDIYHLAVGAIAVDLCPWPCNELQRFALAIVSRK